MNCLKRSKNDLEWYWESVSKDVGIDWKSPYSKILDSSKGIMWSKWFVNGKTNIYSSSVEKFVKYKHLIKLHIILFLKIILPKH